MKKEEKKKYNITPLASVSIKVSPSVEAIFHLDYRNFFFRACKNPI